MTRKNDITLKKKECKVLSFTYKDSTGTIIPLTGCIFSLVVEDADGVEKITKIDADFDKSQVGAGIVKVTFTVTDLTLSAGVYTLEIKTTFTTGEIDKSVSFSLNLIQALTE